MRKVYLVKVYKVKSVAEYFTRADNKRKAIRKVMDGKILKRGKLKFKRPIVSPIYLAFERNGKLER